MNYKYLDAMPWEQYQEYIFRERGTEDVLDDSVGRQRVDVIKKWIGTGKTVLDIASGWGGIASEIREQGNDVTVLDLPEVIKKARELHPKLNFLEGSTLDIPTNDKFDIVLAAEIIEHILDLDRFFSEINRVLKDDGKLIITTPNVGRPFNIISLLMGSTQGWEYFNTPVFHCRHFTPKTLLLTLEKYNFKILGMAGTEANVSIDWRFFTKEEVGFLTKIINKFTSEPAFRASSTCVLCEVGK